MKNIEISRELFEAVYNCDITTDKDMLGGYKNINIYEFAFKCKEWAYNKGYIIKSLYSRNPCIAILETAKGKEEIIDAKTGKTEIEAIIKACIWVLENKDNN